MLESGPRGSTIISFRQFDFLRSTKSRRHSTHRSRRLRSNKYSPPYAIIRSPRFFADPGAGGDVALHSLSRCWVAVGCPSQLSSWPLFICLIVRLTLQPSSETADAAWALACF